MASSDVERELQLLAEGAALRRLARSLLGGHADAEDLVQDTLAASLTSGHADAGKRPWLFGTLRNLALVWRRSSARRVARERAAFEGMRPPGSDPAAIAVQAEAMRDVATAVHELEEPFRTVIVLRFWHGLLPEAIAEALGVPRNTVRSRLQRGLDKLRARLDREYGDRRGWLAALVPFANPTGFAAVAAAPAAGAATTWTTFGTLMMTKLGFVLATAAVAAVGVMAWWLGHDAATPAPKSADDRSLAAVAPASGTGAAAGTATQTAPGPDVEAPRERRVAAPPVFGLTVTGNVTRGGAPCADLTLRVQWFDGVEAVGEPASEQELRSDADGKFVWSGPVRTTVGAVRAVRSGVDVAAKVWCTPEIVQPGQTEADLKVTVLTIDRTVFGRVHDVDGAPIAGAELTVNGWDDVSTRTDADGRYELKVTGPPYPLLVFKPGYRERLLTSYIPEGTQRHALDVELEPGAMFSGRVVDEAGKPVAGAQVRSSGLQLGTTTDVDGRFTFGGAAPEARYLLTAKKTGFQKADVTASPGGEPVELVLRPGLALAVRVIDVYGKAIAGARISVMEEFFRGMQNRGFTDAEGRLRIVDLPAKAITVLADKAGFVKARGDVDLQAMRDEFVLVLRPGRTVAGRVLDTAGASVVGASVYCQVPGADITQRSVGSRATSDTEGRFTIQELPPEPCTVTATHPDYRQAVLAGVSGTPTDLVLRMQPAASVAGRVVDGVTGAPIGAFTIVLTAKDHVQPLHLASPARFADADGWWRVKHWQLTPGAPLFVEVWAEGYAPQRVPAAPQVDAPRDQNVIRMFAGTTVTGVVRDAATGAPVPQVEVTLQSGDPKEQARQVGRDSPNLPVKTHVFSDAEGHFELRSVPPGENRIVLAHGDYPKRTFGPFEVAAGSSAMEVQPELTHGATLRGRVTGLADTAGKKIAVHVFEDKTIETVVDTDGSFELRGVGPGKASLSLTTGKGSWHSMRLEVRDEDIDGIVFAVPRIGTGSIRAVVVGLPHGRGSVETLDVPPGQCKTVRAFEYTDAAFVVDALPPGRYGIEVFNLGSDGSGKAEVTVGYGEVAVTVDFVRK